uniref:Uncharacterized protein n=1 Tax=Octopus bimaculoides TaxID=37653 RepID=A0A0L8I9H6_OCTBM
MPSVTLVLLVPAFSASVFIVLPGTSKYSVNSYNFDITWMYFFLFLLFCLCFALLEVS